MMMMRTACGGGFQLIKSSPFFMLLSPLSPPRMLRLPQIRPRVSALGAPLRRARSTSSGDASAPRLAIALTAAGIVPFFFYGAQHASTKSAAGRGVPWGDTFLLSLPAPLGAAAHSLFGAQTQAGVRARFAGYSATILSFVGALHWGLAAAAPTKFARVQYSLGVLPALVGWAALNVESGGSDTRQIALLAAGFVGVHFLDAAAGSAKPTAATPAWFVGLRTPVTSLVLATHCLAMYVIRDPSISDVLR